jgi:hypothetical protein
VIAFLDEGDRDVPALEALGEVQASLPGNRVVEHAVQQPHRAGERDLVRHYEMTAAVFEQREPMCVAIRIVFRGQSYPARLPTRPPLCLIKP